MDFYYKTFKKTNTAPVLRFVDRLIPDELSKDIFYIEKLSHLDYIIDESEESIQLIMGDVIRIDTNENQNKGIFYRIVSSTKQKNIEILPDFNCFLPLYYYQNSEIIVVSSSISCIALSESLKQVNPIFRYEMSLLNYPVGTNTFFSEIKRIRYGEKLQLDIDGISIDRNRRFYDLLLIPPIPFKKALKSIVDVFIENISYYFNNPCEITLTGGFDGRTVTACAHNFGIDFSCFSYGRETNDDVYIPYEISKKLNLDYSHLDVDSAYIENDYSEHVKRFIYFTGGMNGFLYPLCIYSADNRLRGNCPIITGYCGSELLRNAHRGGAITSQTIIDYLNNKNELNVKIRNHNAFAKEILEYDEDLVNSVIGELDTYFNDLPDAFSVNQKLGIYEFEESVPKIFGSWIYSGMHFQRIRVPFMDRNFLENITKTQVSQFYRNFLENNPLRRFYGQLLYSKIMNKTWPEIGQIISGKGYAPSDLLTIFGRLRITVGYFKKNMKAKKQEFDNLALISGALKYINDTIDNEVQKEYLIRNLNDSYRNEVLRDSVFSELSQKEYGYLLKKLTEGK